MKLISYLFLLSLALTPFTGQTQTIKPFAGQAHTGFAVGHMDLSDSDYPGERPNLFVSGGLSYYLEIMDAWIMGDVMAGSLDGNNDTVFFTNVFYDATLSIKFDILKWVVSSPFKVSPELGLGMILYNAKLYNIETRDFIQESPRPTEKPLSPNPNFNFGVSLSYALTDDVDIEAGYQRKTIFGNDYVDGFLLDSPFETFDTYSVGMSFKFGKGRRAKSESKSKRPERGEDVVEMTNDEYSALVYRIDSLKRKLAQEGDSIDELSIYRTQTQRLEETVGELRSKVDSLEAEQVFDIDFSLSDTTDFSLDADAFDEAKYHLVLSSHGTEQEALEYISRSTLEKEEMSIIFIPLDNRYSVLYKTFDNFLLARKEKGLVKYKEPRVWISRF